MLHRFTLCFNKLMGEGNKCLLIAAFKDRNLFPGYWEDNQRPPGYCILRLVVFIGTAC